VTESDRPETLRVAFLTPEFPSDGHTSGGIGNYVLKMATVLSRHGIEVEVFVPGPVSGPLTYAGVHVERVPAERSLWARAVARGLRLLVGPRGSLLLNLLDARRLAVALERRHQLRPFGVVQSSNHNLSGAFVRPTAGRVHAIRISTSRTLYDQSGGRRHAAMGRFIERLDVRIMRRADLVYAPSAFLADHFTSRHGIAVEVVRPPAELGAVPAPALPFELPSRYLVHYGKLSARKGTDVVARALVEAWQHEPDLQMVWVGPIAKTELAAYRAAWGARTANVRVLGTQDKAILYRVVLGAAASVLPSTVDNLPNTVIESLALGTPVIGSDGASIDELVEHGSSGLLVPIGDSSALAEAMLVAWRGQAPWLGDGFVAPDSLRAMHPDQAVKAFLEEVERGEPSVR
jgi:glycosyltransferase involved in cell wall biosynthesis